MVASVFLNAQPGSRGESMVLVSDPIRNDGNDSELVSDFEYLGQQFTGTSVLPRFESKGILIIEN